MLQPKFDLQEFIDWYSERDIDLEKEGYAPIQEVTTYFKNLGVPKKLATKITEIYQDGGNDIYLQLIAFADGDEDYWDIEKVDDLEHFPNLKRRCFAMLKMVFLRN